MLSYISNGKIKDWKGSFTSNIEQKKLYQQKSNTLTSLKMLSHLIIEKTRQFVPVSSNLPIDGEERICSEILVKLTRVRGQGKEDKSFIKDIHNSSIEGIKKPSDSLFFPSLGKRMTYAAIWERVNDLPDNRKSRSDFEHIEFNAVKALKFGAGNCGELTALAFLLFLEYDDNMNNIKIEEKIPIQIVSLEREDHKWIILNLTREDSLREFSWWGNNTIFCDAWSRQVFTKGELIANLTENELEIINYQFRFIWVFDPKNYFVGKRNNTEPIHTKKWMTNHSSMKSRQKFWRPLQLTDAKIPDKHKLNQFIKNPLVALFSIEEDQQFFSVEIGELVVFINKREKNYELNIRKEGKNILMYPLPLSKQDILNFSKLHDDSSVINAILKHPLPRKRALTEAIINEQLKLVEPPVKSQPRP